jgi:hypothetical protein
LHPTNSRPRLVRIFISLALTLLFAAGSVAFAWTPNSQELEIGKRLNNTSGQRRAFLTLDPILSQVARERAADMARRGYFDHINPDGHGANYLVRRAGYILPSNYPGDGNNLESIAAGQPNPSEAWSDWMGSSDHKRHLLGEVDFFAAQTSYGVGYVDAPGSQYRHYWVVITAPPMPNPASITIATPADGAPVPEGAVVASGATSGSRPAAIVQLSLENGGGLGPWRTASGTQSWNLALENLTPGANTLRVRSLDAGGAVLAQSSRTFQYIVLRPLTVRVVGDGSVGKFLGITSRQVGRSYTITASAAEGSIFKEWSGSWSGTAPTVAFTMAAGLDVTATFVPNPFLARRGKYLGAIGGSNAAHDSRGLLRLKLDALGGLSGRLWFAGKDYAVQGRFNLDGIATVRLARDGTTPLRLTLSLDLAHVGAPIAGTLKDGDTVLSFSTGAAMADSAPIAGRYTVLLPSSDALADPPAPQGDGFATLVVGEDGSATISGVLADGVEFSRGTWIETGRQLEIYAPLHEGRGSLAGTLTFTDTATSDVAGSLRWSKPAQGADRWFPRGFDTTVAAVGARYTPPAGGVRVIAVSNAVPNVRLVFGNGNLAAQIAQPAFLTDINAITISSPTVDGFSALVKTPTGVFKGSFAHPARETPATFRGVILQKQNAGAGFFLGADASGYVDFAPAQ